MRVFERHACDKGALRVSIIERGSHNNIILILATLLPIAMIVWSYWPAIVSLFNSWQNSDDYSAGQLVPIVALLLLWRERKSLKECPFVPCWWAGIPLLLLAITTSICLFLAGSHPSSERYLIIMTLTAVVVLVGGWQILNTVKWIILFLLLMVPLPGRVHSLIAAPLQSMATAGSTFILEAFVKVTRQGNTMILNDDTPIGVAEACSGLRMLMAFIIVAAFIAYMIRRPRWQKAILLISSIPVAVVCNIVRIVVTVVLMLHVDAEVADKFFHDFAGVIMMPVAVMLIFAELWLMDSLTISEPDPQHVHKRTQTKHPGPSPAG